MKEEQQNAPDWWDSEEGRAFKAEYNTESGKMARIHVKVWDEQVRRPDSTLLNSNMHPCATAIDGSADAYLPFVVQGYQVLKTSMRDNDPEVRHYSTEALKYLEHYKFTPGAPLSPKKADA